MPPRKLHMVEVKPETILVLMEAQCPELPAMLQRVASFFDEAQSVQPYQAAVLYWLAQQYDGGLIVELGTRHGYTAAILALAAPTSEIVTVDTIQQVTADGWPKTIEQVLGVSWEVADYFEDGEVAMVFVDADHAQVERDFSAWWPKLKLGGLMLFHDYSARFPEVIKTVKRIADDPDIVVIDTTGEGMAGVYQA